MVRNLTANTTTKTTTRLATEPLVIVEIEWSSGTEYYADKTLSLGGNNCRGEILEFSVINASGKQDTRGDIASASLSLDDTAGLLKTKVNTLILEGTPVTVYHHYEGNLWSDLTIILRGKIAGTIKWDEGERILGFDIETYLEDAEVGYAPAEGEIAGINPDAIGVPWPICFGTVLRVPATAVFKTSLGKSVNEIEGGYSTIEVDPFEVEDGTKFPQLTDITISVGGTLFFGQFDNTTFHRTQSNLIWYTNVPIANRPTDDSAASSLNVCWVAPGYNLAGKYCWTGVGNKFKYCTHQEGTKCYFQYAWGKLLDATSVFAEVRGCVDKTWYVDPTNLINWVVKASRQVYQYNTVNTDLYIVNLYPSTEILEVYGTRDYNETEIFVPIPSSYYTKHQNYAIDGKNVTAIEFYNPLESLESEDWKGEVYVSLRSTLPSNVSDVIKWLLQTYTGFAIDTASFNTVRSQTNPYPTYFAIFDQPNVLKLIEDIAWQARCALYIHNGIVSIKYLSLEPSPNYSITTTDVILKTLKLGFTSTEDIYTRMDGTWFTDYSGRIGHEHLMSYRKNVDIFGLRTEERDFYIYNIEELVKMSLYFWGYRYANSWRILEYTALFRTLVLEVYDCIRNSIAIVSTNAIKSVLEAVSHDSDANEISMKALMASRAGDSVAGQPVEDSSFWHGDPSYPVQARTIIDPGDGLTEIDYIVPIDDKNSDEKDDTAPDQFYFIFVEPTFVSVERATDFTIEIEVQDKDGKKLINTVSAVLSLHSYDDGDKWLSNGQWEQNINITNGVYSITDAQIVGGSGTDNCFLSCSDRFNRTNWNVGTTEVFDVTDAKTGVLTWDTEPPANVKRGIVFPIAISGGTGGSVETIDTIKTFTDTADKLYDNATGLVITTIELDVSGEYSGSWYIDGGSGTDTDNKVTLKDSLYGKYADKPCTVFSIGGLSVARVSHDVVLKQAISADAAVLSLAFVSGEFNNETPFYLKVELRDDEGTLIPYSGAVTLSIKDSDNDNIPWLLPSAGTTIFVPMTNGEALGLGVECQVQLFSSHDSPATIYAQLTYNGKLMTASVVKSWHIGEDIVQSFSMSQLTDLLLAKVITESHIVDVEHSILATSEAISSIRDTLIAEHVITVEHAKIFYEAVIQAFSVQDIISYVFNNITTDHIKQSFNFDEVLTVVIKNLQAEKHTVNVEHVIHGAIGLISNIVHSIDPNHVITAGKFFPQDLVQSFLPVQVGSHVVTSLDNFLIEFSETSTIKGQSHTFNMTITARDQFNQTVTTFNETVDIALVNVTAGVKLYDSLDVELTEWNLTSGTAVINGNYIDGGDGKTDELSCLIRVAYSTVQNQAALPVYRKWWDNKSDWAGYYYGYDAQSDYGDLTPADDWVTMWNTAWAECNADSSPQSLTGDPVPLAYIYGRNDQAAYVSMRATIYKGYLYWDITDAMRDGADRVYLNLDNFRYSSHTLQNWTVFYKIETSEPGTGSAITSGGSSISYGANRYSLGTGVLGTGPGVHRLIISLFTDTSMSYPAVDGFTAYNRCNVGHLEIEKWP